MDERYLRVELEDFDDGFDFIRRPVIVLIGKEDDLAGGTSRTCGEILDMAEPLRVALNLNARIRQRRQKFDGAVG